MRADRIDTFFSFNPGEIPLSRVAVPSPATPTAPRAAPRVGALAGSAAALPLFGIHCCHGDGMEHALWHQPPALFSRFPTVALLRKKTSAVGEGLLSRALAGWLSFICCHFFPFQFGCCCCRCCCFYPCHVHRHASCVASCTEITPFAKTRHVLSSLHLLLTVNQLPLSLSPPPVSLSFIGAVRHPHAATAAPPTTPSLPPSRYSEDDCRDNSMRGEDTE